MTQVRIRGIYATALTRLLRSADAATVVRPSPAIEDRFDGGFADGVAAVSLSDTRDRHGIEVTGAPADVSAVADALDDVGVDAFSWDDAAAAGSIFTGTVTGTNDGGATVSLTDERTGFLPFGNAADYVESGDAFTVQVAEPRPPWGGGDPVLDTELTVSGDLVTLVRGADASVVDTPDGSPEHELARTTDLLSPDVPEDWGIRWERGAEGQSVATLDAALSSAVAEARDVESALESSSGEGIVAAPRRTRWYWFGRESRFALDEHRRSVTPTLPGHHRLKAGSERASGAVDFAERLGAKPDTFPFEAVVESFGPQPGDRVAIGHGKPDGRYLELGRGTVTDVDVEKHRIVVERAMSGGGRYDALEVPRVEGDTATTRFIEGRWWYPTVYRSEDGDLRGTYVNVSTPIELFPRTVRYVDLHVDVIKQADGTVEIVDREELRSSVEAGTVTEDLAAKAETVAEQVATALRD
ncbi:MAG: DUF402 domain-containing protein [Halanaeroarchaeum sp.]